MKYLILSAALLSATAANAQKFIVGLNGGAAATRSWQKNVGYQKIFETRAQVNPIGNLRIGMTHKNVEFGALASMSRFSYSVDSRTNPAKTWFEPWHYPFTGYDTYVLAERAITIQFYATKKFGKGKLQPYAGGAVGQGRFYIDKPMNERADVNTDVYYSYMNTKTFQLSALAGCNYRITKRLAANVEVTGSYIVGYDIDLDYFKNRDSDYYKHYYSIPVTLGIRYSLL